jgi:hypothetical protein
MDDVRAALERHWTASDANDFDIEHDIYHEDAMLYYPQSGERIRGRHNIQIGHEHSVIPGRASPAKPAEREPGIPMCLARSEDSHAGIPGSRARRRARARNDSVGRQDSAQTFFPISR